MKYIKSKMAFMALGLGIGLSSLLSSGAIAGSSSCTSDTDCLIQERECIERGAPYHICDRQLSRCLYSCN